MSYGQSSESIERGHPAEIEIHCNWYQSVCSGDEHLAMITNNHILDYITHGFGSKPFTPNNISSINKQAFL